MLLRDINFVIMDYLINEGYPAAAKKFAMEANIQPSVEEGSIMPRVEIRDAIFAGDIETAIHKINDLNPEVCPVLHKVLVFSLVIAVIIRVSCTTHIPSGVDDSNSHTSVLSMSNNQSTSLSLPIL